MATHSVMSWRSSLATVWCTFLLVTLATGSGTFDCRRPGQNLCYNSACNSNGACNCPAGWSGYACTLGNSYIHPAQCSPPCSSFGTCIVGAIPLCACDADHFDYNTCATPLHRVVCEGDTMTINIVPLGTFTGIIYMHGHSGTCVFQKASQMTGLPGDFNHGNARVIPNTNSDCGNAKSVTKTQTQEIISRRVYVQYNADFPSSTDEVVDVECERNRNTGVITATSFTSVNAGSIREGTSGGSQKVLVSAFGDLNPLRLTVQKDGVQVTANTQIIVGTVLNLELNVFPETDFENVLVKSLTVDNNKEGADLQTLSIINDGCHVGGNFADIIPEPTRTSGSLKTVFTFTTIKFPKSQDIRITLAAELCGKGDTMGCKATCGISRRRRGAGSRDIDTIQVIIKLWDNTKDEKQTAILHNDSNTEEPAGNEKNNVISSGLLGLSRGILSAIIALGAFIIVFIVVVIVFTWRILRKKKETEKCQNFS